jgi:6-phosphofructokinase
MPVRKIKRIAILTGGGDCPGLNAVIRAVAKTAQNDHNIEVIGIMDSYWGLGHEDFKVLHNHDVSGILGVGGTILGTSRLDPFQEGYRQGLLSSPEENWDIVKSVLKKHQIDALVAVGGDGTLRVAARMAQAGIAVVGVPKTIDNDIGETDVTFGFNSAVSIIMEALDRLHTTAMSHHRVMVVEVMGRTVGWLALHSAGRVGRHHPDSRNSLLRTFCSTVCANGAVWANVSAWSSWQKAPPLATRPRFIRVKWTRPDAKFWAASAGLWPNASRKPPASRPE